MKRILSGLLLVVLLFTLTACGEKIDKETPQMGDYQVEVNGRTYTTAGTPFCHIPTVENRGYLDYRTAFMGTVGQELNGTFPAGTTVHGIKGGDNRFLLVGVLPETNHCYLLTSFDYYDQITVGRTLLESIDFHNSFAYIYRFSADKEGLIFVPMSSSELSDLGTCYGEAIPLAPAGASVELVMQNFNGDFGLFTLYENGAIVFEGCDRCSFGLGEEMTRILWGKVKA